MAAPLQAMAMQGQQQNVSQGQNVPPQTAGPSQQQQQTQPQSQESKLDNLGKVKSLLWPLKETLANTMKVAAQNVYQNATIDMGLKSSDSQIPRFDKSLEEFYSICDQIELNLKTALECCNLTGSSHHYCPLALSHSKSEGSQENYNQYINVVRTQVAYAKEIHDALAVAARNITSNE